MHINRVTLGNFRNIAAADIELGGGINVLFGENAQGKTNFLEAVYFCATGRSHRAGRDKELIKMTENEARIALFAENRGNTSQIDMRISREGKECKLNGLPIRRLGELFGHLSCVMFSPEDLALVKAGPTARRRFMDMELCQLYPAYYHNLRMYYKVLKQRNNLLKELGRSKKQLETLVVWDEQLAEYGIKIMAHRGRFVEKLSGLSGINQRNITAGREDFAAAYKPNARTEDFADKLAKSRNTDILRGTTSVGIHKDDIEFKINGADSRLFASQGQQRTAALALKLAQIDFIREEKGHPPVLLLDDVLSELDKGRQNYLLEVVSGLQTIITLTGAESAVGSYLRKDALMRIFGVESGEISLKNM